jgi:ribonuclease D
MDIAPCKPAVWVNTSQGLTEAFQALESQPRIAVDTESNSLFSYQEKVCLIQISSPETDYVFDPFEFTDLSLLGLLFQNPKQEKIFHASEYDLICLKRDYHFTFVNIFDTMIAARILGAPQVGLGSLLQKYFDINLEKKYQRANWGLRPLPPEMLDYARLDTYYLFKLRDILESELSTHELLDLALEDFSNACNAAGHASGNGHDTCWKLAGSGHPDPRQVTILKELCAYRDEQAKKADLPHFKILSNDMLVEVSLHRPTTFDELSLVPHFSEKLVKRHGIGLLKAVARGENAPLVTRTKNHRPDDAFLARIDCLKNWRKNTAKKLEVESDVILPREMLEHIASTNPDTKLDLKTAMGNSPIRYKKYGTLIMKALKKTENL